MANTTELSRDIRMKLHDIRNHMHLFSGRRALQERLREDLDELFTDAITMVHSGADHSDIQEVLEAIHDHWSEYADQGESMEEAYDRIVSIILDTAEHREPETISLGRVVEREITYCQTDLKKLPAERVVYTQAQAAFVRAARVPLRRMVQNLLYNAAEAVEGGDGRIAAVVDLAGVAEERDGMLGSVRPGTYATLTLSNDGGELPTELEKILRVGFSSKEADERGLGMAIVHDVLEAYDGNLEVVPHDEGGVTVRVYLPAVEPDGEVRRELSPGA